MGHFGTNLGQKSYKNYIIYAKYNQYKIYCYGLEMLIYCGFKWSGQRDSNPRHQAWEAWRREGQIGFGFEKYCFLFF